jgi:hypothetical protein
MRISLVALLLGALWMPTVLACGDDAETNVNEEELDPGLTNLEASPSELKFAQALAGQQQALKIVFSNTGEGNDLFISSFYLEDPQAPFTVSGQMASDLEAAPDGRVQLLSGAHTSLVVTYTATPEVPEPTRLAINSNASNGSKLYVSISVGESTAGLYVAPDPIEFGEVLGGDTDVIPVTISNMGTSDMSVSNVFLQLDGSKDFLVADPPEFPQPLLTGKPLVIDLVYIPQGGGDDLGALAVAYSDALGTQGLKVVQVHGMEVGPEISISPAKLDFGWVPMETKSTATLYVHNMGEHNLKVSKVYVAPMSNEDLAIDNPPAGDLTIASGGNEPIAISITPKTFFSTTADPIGGIVIQSNDADEGLVTVPVYASIDAPFIKVEPPDNVDFGIVAQGWKIKRTLVLQNVGHAPLEVDLIEFTDNTPAGEFAYGEGNTFAPATPEGGTGSLVAEQKAEIYLEFENNGAAYGVELGNLHIHSNDPITPDVYVKLSAVRGGSPKCELAFEPPKLDFGCVAHGGEKSLAMAIKNKGSGYCSWKSGLVRGCSSMWGLATTCSDSAGKSENFIPQGFPIPVQDGMAPGTKQQIQILYKPPTTIPWIPLNEDYYGVLQITYTEPYSVPGVYTEHEFPEGSGTLQWNVHGSSGVADIAILPDEIAFGLVTIGCYSQTFCVKVYNAGTAPLQVKDIYTDGCGPEFTAKDYPELPMEIAPSQFDEVCVVYLPQNEGPDECKLVVESSDMDTPVAYVPLTGEGTWEKEHVDYFTQISGKKVDILFVVDGSPSMCGELDNLAENMNALASVAAQWGNDYQIGIVHLDLDEKETVAKLSGSPSILTKATVGSFADNVNAIGCDTSSGGQEAGLEAGRKALTAPYANDAGIPCTCANGQACPACTAPDTCVNGGCGGPNRGLVRTDAALEVVFVSDEEDQSPGSVPFYIDFYKSIKGFLNDNLFHAHAIVGDKNGGCSVSQDDGADAGKRYIEVQEGTGGVFGSICDDNFSTVLKDIGNKAFGLQVQFFLSAQADGSPGTIKVWVDSGAGYVECAQGWEYQKQTNSVVFDENGPCMPKAGDKIKIWYKMVCNTQ